MLKSVPSQIAVCFCTVALFTAPAFAQEHPTEHPSGSGTSKKNQEHPTKKTDGQAASSSSAGSTTGSVSMQDLSKAIEKHVKQKAEGGKFTLTDPQTNEKLSLELVEVHEDKLAKTAENTYFACVDMKAANGKTYDIDFFLTGTSPENLKVTESSIHKVDGKPRYTWTQEQGMWKKKEVAGNQP